MEKANPMLETERLFLRPFQREDGLAMLPVLSHREVNRFYLGFQWTAWKSVYIFWKNSSWGQVGMRSAQRMICLRWAT